MGNVIYSDYYAWRDVLTITDALLILKCGHVVTRTDTTTPLRARCAECEVNRIRQRLEDSIAAGEVFKL